MEPEITIRQIQHFLYCPHRWGMMEIDRDWEENAFVVKADIIHDRVHNPDKTYTLRGRRVFTAVSVYNDLPQYGIYGVTDCIEAEANESGIALDDGKKYLLTIVEYKPTSPKEGLYHYEDLMQVFAQKVCLDHIFHCCCRGVLYYADQKKRVELPLEENYSEYDDALKKQLKKMRELINSGIIPPIAKEQKCNGCSMKDVCMPKIKKCCSVRRCIEVCRNSDGDVL